MALCALLAFNETHFDCISDTLCPSVDTDLIINVDQVCSFLFTVRTVGVALHFSLRVDDHAISKNLKFLSFYSTDLFKVP